MTRLAFVDIETTGLVVGMHEPWEIAYIVRDEVNGRRDQYEKRFLLKPDLSMASPDALRISRFYDRTVAYGVASTEWADPQATAREVAEDLAGAHLVGAVPDFDAKFIAPWLRQHGQAAAWHYHLIDTEALMVGFVAGKQWVVPTLPWSSRDLAAMLGIEQPGYEEHTAMGDARWAMRCYDAVMA